MSVKILLDLVPSGKFLLGGHWSHDHVCVADLKAGDRLDAGSPVGLSFPFYGFLFGDNGFWLFSWRLFLLLHLCVVATFALLGWRSRCDRFFLGLVGLTDRLR